MERFLVSRITDPRYNTRASALNDAFWTRPSWEEALHVTRSNASLKRARDEAKQGPCWDGYHKVAGMADYAEDSCVKNGTSAKKKKKYKKKRKSKKGSGESDTGTDTEPTKKKD